MTTTAPDYTDGCNHWSCYLFTYSSCIVVSM